MSGNDADEYLSDGMTEEIITALSKVSGLRVAARSSSFFFKEKNEDIEKDRPAAARRHCPRRQPAKGGTKLRVTVQLINVSDGYHLWSETYDEDATDILVIQTEVAHRVASALKVALLAGEQERLQQKPKKNHYAYDHGCAKAIEYFERAIDTDLRSTTTGTGETKLSRNLNARRGSIYSPSPSVEMDPNFLRC